MNNDEKQIEIKRGRGRPPLPDAQKKPKRNYHKESGYVAQKKYHKEKCYEPKVLIPIESRQIIDDLLLKTGMSISTLFLDALETKYSVKLKKD